MSVLLSIEAKQSKQNLGALSNNDLFIIIVLWVALLHIFVVVEVTQATIFELSSIGDVISKMVSLSSRSLCFCTTCHYLAILSELLYRMLAGF